jgi:hypothetical protein
MLSEVIFAFALFVIVLLFFLQSLMLPLLSEDGLLAPGFLPFLLTLILLVLMVCYIVKIIIYYKKNIRVNKSSSKSKIKQQVFLLGAMGLSVYVAKYLGLLVALTFFLLITLVFIEKLSWARSTIFSLSLMICVYLIFDVWLGIRLPKGIFG